MKKLLKRILSSPREDTETSGQDERFPPDLTLQYQRSVISPARIDQVFFGNLLGVNSVIDNDLNPFEQNAIKQLQSLLKLDLATSNLLPRSPAVLPKIIHSLRKENSNAQEISRLIEQDPVLLADVMKLVNSPYYMTRNKIVTLHQATVMLGRDGLRKLVTGAIVRPMLDHRNGHFSKLAASRLWDLSGKTALAASAMSADSEETIFHSYLAGILKNIGYTVTLKQLDKLFDEQFSPNSAKFITQFIAVSNQLTHQIALAWSLPTSICQALDNKPARRSDNESRIIARNLFIADALAKATVTSEKLGIDPQKTDVMLDQELCSQCKYAFENISFKIDF